MPAKQLKKLIVWLIMHKDELYSAWNNAVRGLHFDKIEPTPPIKEEITEPKIADIIVLPDPSTNVSLIDDPYLQIPDYVLDTYHPDRELYNYLFRAIDQIEEKVNISNYNLSNEIIMNTCESLYNQSNFQFYYLSRVRWSNDYKEVSFIYTDKPELIQTNKQIYYANMSHLLYNVAPENF